MIGNTIVQMAYIETLQGQKKGTCRLHNAPRVPLSLDFPVFSPRGTGREELRHYRIIVILWSGPCARLKIYRSKFQLRCSCFHMANCFHVFLRACKSCKCCRCSIFIRLVLFAFLLFFIVKPDLCERIFCSHLHE